MPDTASTALLPPSVLAWITALLLPAAVAVAVLSALLERSGPIRLRHWAEEAGGGLRRLYDHPVRFGVYRFILSLAGRLAPIVLFLALEELLRAWNRGAPRAWALAVLSSRP